MQSFKGHRFESGIAFFCVERSFWKLFENCIQILNWIENNRRMIKKVYQRNNI